MGYLKGLLFGVLCCLSATVVWGGSIDSPAGPTSGDSAMYTVTDVYNRINNGTAGTKRTTTFGEPTAAAFDAGAPKSTGYDLDDLYDLASERSRPAETGQTPTIPLNPAPAGSDGALQKGVAWPSPRFTDNINGTVTDNLTGLIWLKNANCFGTRNWATALTDCHGLNDSECGLTDGSSEGAWRLPNRFELESLLDLCYSTPALCNAAGTGKWSDGNAFTGVMPNNYWSSSTSANSDYFAWYVNLGFGDTNCSNKTSSYYVWPVRGGQ